MLRYIAAALGIFADQAVSAQSLPPNFSAISEPNAPRIASRTRQQMDLAIETILEEMRSSGGAGAEVTHFHCVLGTQRDVMQRSRYTAAARQTAVAQSNGDSTPIPQIQTDNYEVAGVCRAAMRDNVARAARSESMQATGSAMPNSIYATQIPQDLRNRLGANRQLNEVIDRWREDVIQRTTRPASPDIKTVEDARSETIAGSLVIPSQAPANFERLWLFRLGSTTPITNNSILLTGGTAYSMGYEAVMHNPNLASALSRRLTPVQLTEFAGLCFSNQPPTIASRDRTQHQRRVDLCIHSGMADALQDIAAGVRLTRLNAPP